MSRLRIIVLLAVALALGVGLGVVTVVGLGEVQAGGGTGPDCQVTVEVQSTPTFVGVTSTPRALDAGYPLFNADCNSEYPNSRMCSDEMILASIPAPVPGVAAIVQMNVYGASEYNAYGAGGVSVGNDFDVNCSGSSLFDDNNAGDRAEILAASGNLMIVQCNTATTYVIACCALQ